MKIPEPSGNEKKTRRGGRTAKGLPEPQAPDGGDFDPYLKASDIGEVGDTGKLKVTGPPEESDSEFSDAFMPVTYQGKAYAMGIKWASPNYRKLYDQFGKNPKKWRGVVNVKIKHFKNNDYVAIV